MFLFFPEASLTKIFGESFFDNTHNRNKPPFPMTCPEKYHKKEGNMKNSSKAVFDENLPVVIPRPVFRWSAVNVDECIILNNTCYP